MGLKNDGISSISWEIVIRNIEQASSLDGRVWKINSIIYQLQTKRISIGYKFEENIRKFGKTRKLCWGPSSSKTDSRVRKSRIWQMDDYSQ